MEQAIMMSMTKTYLLLKVDCKLGTASKTELHMGVEHGRGKGMGDAGVEAKSTGTTGP
jgi:hypothetical protein